MTIFDIAPLNVWRKLDLSIRRGIRCGDYADTVRLAMRLELYRLCCKKLEAENAELRQALRTVQWPANGGSL